MRLTRKFMVALALVTLMVLGINAWLRVRRDDAMFDEDIWQDHEFAGRVLAHAVPPGVCRDPEGLAIFLWADNGAGRFL